MGSITKIVPATFINQRKKAVELHPVWVMNRTEAQLFLKDVNEWEKYVHINLNVKPHCVGISSVFNEQANNAYKQKWPRRVIWDRHLKMWILQDVLWNEISVVYKLMGGTFEYNGDADLFWILHGYFNDRVWDKMDDVKFSVEYSVLNMPGIPGNFTPPQLGKNIVRSQHVKTPKAPEVAKQSAMPEINEANQLTRNLVSKFTTKMRNKNTNIDNLRF